MDKKAVIAGIIGELENQKIEMEKGLVSTRQAAKESPSAMESHSDTTRNQMQTIAASIERAVKEKETAIAMLKKYSDSGEKINTVKDGTVVEIEGERNEKKIYIVVPEGGAGAMINLNGAAITSITLKTPLGAALANKKAGETAILKNASGERKLKILGIF